VTFFCHSFSWAELRDNPCARQPRRAGRTDRASRLLLSRFRPYTIGFPPIKQPLALEAEAVAFGCPNSKGGNGERKCTKTEFIGSVISARTRSTLRLRSGSTGRCERKTAGSRFCRWRPSGPGKVPTKNGTPIRSGIASLPGTASASTQRRSCAKADSSLREEMAKRAKADPSPATGSG
jgi:hypothetical protein